MELLCDSLGLSILCSLEHRAQTLYCVYTLRTRYVTVYIVTLFAPSDAGLRHELSSDYRVVDCARWNTETRCPLFFSSSIRSRPCTQAPCPNSCLLLEKRCVHISIQRVPYSGTVPGHQVWTLPLSPPERPLFVEGRLGRKKKRTQGARWEGEREEERPQAPAIPSSRRPPRAFNFFCSIIAIL